MKNQSIEAGKRVAFWQNIEWVVMIDERRNDQRIELRTPIGIDSPGRPGRVGVTRNVSSSGVLFCSASRFAPGERLELVFRGPDKRERRRTGRVVRTQSQVGESVFRFLAAVCFEA